MYAIEPAAMSASITESTGIRDLMATNPITPESWLIVAAPLLPGQSARFAKALAQNELDLRIETPQIVVRPLLHRCQCLLVDTKRKRFSCRHRPVGSSPRRSGVERTRIEDGLSTLLAT